MDILAIFTEQVFKELKKGFCKNKIITRRDNRISICERGEDKGISVYVPAYYGAYKSGALAIKEICDDIRAGYEQVRFTAKV